MPSTMKAMAHLYDLTPAELRVLHSIIEVGEVPVIAAAFGISPGTVRTHLHHIFQKTSTERQVDLVRLVVAVERTSVDQS
jgi:DNA-binding CsgD family transcriptional regulator